MSEPNAMCLHCRERFWTSSTYVAYGGAVFCSMDCLRWWTAEHKEPSEIDEVIANYEVRLSSEPEDEQDETVETKSSSEVSIESRRAGYRLEAEFECFDSDEYLWLDATPIADADQVKFRSEACPECGAFHWTGCAQ